MSNEFDRLRGIVSEELEKQKHEANTQTSVSIAKRFGAFVSACLKRSGISDTEFAHRLDIEPELGVAILAGLLPVTDIDDALIIEIADIIQHQPNTLHIILERSVTPTVDKSSWVSSDT